MKKTFFILAFILILLFALAACDGGNAPHTHTFGEWETTKESSCLEEGTKERICSCGEKESETIPATGHTFGEWIVDEEATCVTTGTRHHICEVCGTSVSETYSDANAHNYATEWTSDDESHWHVCLNAGCASIPDNSAHTFGEWIVDEVATCITNGTRHHVCTVCNKFVSESYDDPTAHNYATTWATDEMHHWQVCQNSGCTSVPDKTTHFWNNENTCTVCQRSIDAGLKFAKKSDRTYSVDDYVGSASKVIIPPTYNGIAVTSIGDYAFYYCSSLTSITIPSSVTSIGPDAFKYCSSLTSIAIPSSVTSIGSSAFSECYSLMSITIPSSVTSIGAWAFSGCFSLASITFGENSKLTSIGSYAFWDCSLTSITIPSSVTGIGSDAFSGCRSLTSITIPSSVTSIGEGAFSDCDSLASITVEKGNTVYHSAGNCLIEKASKTLIAGCQNSVIPSDGSVTSIGESAFESCSSLTSITIPDSVTSIGDGAFRSCTSLTSITIPSSVTSIGAWAFSYCTSLTSITIPDSVMSIGDGAFKYCDNLTSITIPSSVTSIGSNAFWVCDSLTSITFGGTKAQWENVSKGYNWNYYTPTITVYCTDGNIRITD